MQLELHLLLLLLLLLLLALFLSFPPPILFFRFLLLPLQTVDLCLTIVQVLCSTSTRNFRIECRAYCDLYNNMYMPILIGYTDTQQSTRPANSSKVSAWRTLSFPNHWHLEWMLTLRVFWLQNNLGTAVHVHRAHRSVTYHHEFSSRLAFGHTRCCVYQC